MTDHADAYLFLSGADMDPQAVRHAHPDARFVARARIQAKRGEIHPEFGAAVAATGVGEVWGILLRAPAAPADAVKQREATTDDGRTFTATLVGDRLLNGLGAETLRAAQYWELPPPYVARLKQAVTAAGHLIGAAEPTGGA